MFNEGAVRHVALINPSWRRSYRHSAHYNALMRIWHVDAAVGLADSKAARCGKRRCDRRFVALKKSILRMPVPVRAARKRFDNIRPEDTVANGPVACRRKNNNATYEKWLQSRATSRQDTPRRQKGDTGEGASPPAVAAAASNTFRCAFGYSRYASADVRLSNETGTGERRPSVIFGTAASPHRTFRRNSIFKVERHPLPFYEPRRGRNTARERHGPGRAGFPGLLRRQLRAASYRDTPALCGNAVMGVIAAFELSKGRDLRPVLRQAF